MVSISRVQIASRDSAVSQTGHARRSSRREQEGVHELLNLRRGEKTGHIRARRIEDNTGTVSQIAGDDRERHGVAVHVDRALERAVDRGRHRQIRRNRKRCTAARR